MIVKTQLHDALTRAYSDTESESNESVQTAGFFEENLVIIFGAGGTVFLLIAIAIIICCIRCRRRQRERQESGMYTSATYVISCQVGTIKPLFFRLQKLDNNTDDFATIEHEQKPKYEETYIRPYERTDSFDTLGSSNDDGDHAAVPLSKFDQPSQSMKKNQEDLPPPPDVL